MASAKNLQWLTLSGEEFRQLCKTYLKKEDRTDSQNFHDRNLRKEAESWGRYAEAITAKYLITLGLPIREWDWKPGKGKGEIDLITQKGNRIIFIEVKARNGKNEDPWDAITPMKIRDLCIGADKYLKLQDENFDYQFDLAFLKGNFDDYEFEYIEDAFLCPLKK